MIFVLDSIMQHIMLNHLCISGINLSWHWCMVFIMCCFVDFRYVFILKLCLYVHMSVCRNVYVSPCTQRGQRHRISLNLELEVVVSQLMCILGNELGYSSKPFPRPPGSINMLLNSVFKLFIGALHLCSSMTFVYSSLSVLCSDLILE